MSALAAGRNYCSTLPLYVSCDGDDTGALLQAKVELSKQVLEQAEMSAVMADQKI